MLYDHDQYFIPKTNSLGRKINNLWEYFFFEIKYSNLINCLGGMCQTCEGIIICGMFEFSCVNIES
jgi:hypothetical protein